MRRLILALIALAAAIALAVPLIAQESDAQQKDWLLQFIEGQLSAPGREIAISGIDGVLSSDVTIPEITISDDEGVWLRVENATLNWDQGALLGGTLQINRLSADKVEYLRPAVPPRGVDLPPPEAGTLEIPDLPVAINLDELSVPSVTFGEEVFGLGSEISVSGRLKLAGGSLDTKLDIERLDGPGGTLVLTLAYDKASENTDIDLALTEPPDGLIVNLLGMAGKPDVVLSLKGSGPLSSLGTDLSLDVDGKRTLTGRAELTRTAEGLDVTAKLDGPIANLVPVEYKSFFGAQTRLATHLVLHDGGGISLDTLNLEGGALVLAASAETMSDGFVKKLGLDARIVDQAGGRVFLPGGGGNLSLGGARMSIAFGETDAWTGSLEIEDFDSTDFSAQAISLGLSGAATNLEDPDTRRVTFNGDGRVMGITSDSPELAEALGTELGLGLAGLWSRETKFQLAELRFAGKAFEMALAGVLDGFTFDGDLTLATPSVAAFSSLAGSELSGAVDLAAKGTINALSGGFDLNLSGSARDLDLGVGPLAAVLAGDTNLSGRIARTEAGLAADSFRIGNAQSEITANGTFASDNADFRFTLALADLELLSENASGALNATGTARGENGNIVLAFDASVPTGKLGGHTLREARLGFGGVLTDETLNGNISGLAFLDGHRAELSAGLVSAKSENRLSDLRFATQGATLTGALLQDKKGLLTGAVALDANDITLAAALLFTEASGSAKAKISLAPANDEQTADVTAETRNLDVADAVRIGTATINAKVVDLFGVPRVDGSIDASDVTAGGVDIASLSADASQRGDQTGFAAKATLDNGAIITTAGSLAPAGKGYRFVIDSAALDKGSVTARLAAPTSLTIAGETVILEAMNIDVGKGRIVSSGSAGDRLELAVTLSDVPLSVANAVMPELGLSGAFNGRLDITGTPSRPRVSFNVSGDGISANSISEFGVTPLSVSARGTFANQTVDLASAHADGPFGLAVDASGSLPLGGSGVNVGVRGTLPLALARRVLASRGAQIAGTANLDMRLSGSLSRLAYSGGITVDGAEFVDPATSLRLQQISARASLSGDSVLIESLSGSLATGGTISAGGTVSLDADRGMPADLTLNLNSARYADGNLFVATVSGQLTVSGPLTGGAVLSGDLFLEKADIGIPDAVDGDAALLKVAHVDPSAAVVETLDRVRSNSANDGNDGGNGSLRLDININAPNQVFVRGRGVDAELGGQVRLTGPIDDIRPVGGFELIRGRLIILGQRIDFDTGTVSLVGNLDPYIDLTASSPGSDITVYIAVRGPASNLDISFSSLPELPQDEVLSQLIFKRTLGDLSPLQVAKLAAAASELAGGGGSSLTDNLRSAAGLADLDLITDAEGNTAVRAGAYLQDNIYLGVEAGAQGKSKVTIDLDLTDSVKASGSTSTDGETKVGVFYEQDF